MKDQETTIETEPTIELQTAGKASKAPPKKRVRGNAVTRLAKATARIVRDNSDKLSDALFKRALEGDVNCTKLLVALTEKCPQKKRKHKSMALLLANSPQWKGDWPKAPEDELSDDELRLY